MIETDLTKKYCKSKAKTIFFEVSVGSKSIFGKNSTDRKIDIVVIHGDNTRKCLAYSKNKDMFLSLLKNTKKEIEIIEVKKKLNRNVIGQILVGEFMFKKKFKVRKIKKSILYNKGDDALELFCKKNQIDLIKL